MNDELKQTVKTMQAVFDDMDKDFTVYEYRTEIKTLLDLATKVLAIEGVMPKEKDIPKAESVLNNLYEDGYNLSRHDCILAITKKLEGLEGIIKRIIIDKELMPKVCEDSNQCEWSDGEANKLAQAIVHAIQSHLLGEGEKLRVKDIVEIPFYGHHDIPYLSQIGEREVKLTLDGDLITEILWNWNNKSEWDMLPEGLIKDIANILKSKVDELIVKGE